MPSGLAIGQGLAQGFEKASSNFLASMSAVQEMKMKREKFDMDKKVANAQLERLALDIDPEAHALKKKLTQSQMNLADIKLKHEELVIDQAKNKTKTEFANFKSGLDFMKILSSESPELAARFGFDSKGGWKMAPQAKQSMPGAKQMEEIGAQALELAAKRTKNTKKSGFLGRGTEPDPSEEEIFAAQDEILKRYRGIPGAVQEGGGDQADPVVALIASLKEQGKADDEITSLMSEAGYDPTEYGL